MYRIDPERVASARECRRVGAEWAPGNWTVGPAGVDWDRCIVCGRWVSGPVPGVVYSVESVCGRGHVVAMICGTCEEAEQISREAFERMSRLQAAPCVECAAHRGRRVWEAAALRRFCEAHGLPPGPLTRTSRATILHRIRTGEG